MCWRTRGCFRRRRSRSGRRAASSRASSPGSSSPTAHANLAHIFFNMLALYMFGGEIERLFGSRFYTQYYFACVVAAALCHLIITAAMGAPQVPMVGASGGIYGLLLAFGIYFPHRRVMLLFPPIPMPARIFVFGFAALELFLGITQTAAGVAHFAHLGGMLGGWLMIQWRRRGFPFRM